MSSLALEIDQTMEQLDAVTASRLERLVREALALVKSTHQAAGDTAPGSSVKFPLVEGVRPIRCEDVAALEDDP